MARLSPEMVTALGGIVLGLAPIAAGVAGKRGADATKSKTTTPPPADPTAVGLASLVENLQEERDKAQQRLSETERELREAYERLTAAHDENGELRVRIARLVEERAELRQHIVELGGTPP